MPLNKSPRSYNLASFFSQERNQEGLLIERKARKVATPNDVKAPNFALIDEDGKETPLFSEEKLLTAPSFSR